METSSTDLTVWAVLGAAASMRWLPALLLLGLLPVGAFLHRRAARRTHLATGGTGLDMMALEPQYLPTAVRQFFDAQHPDLDMLGFAFVGDCQIVQGPSPVYCRYYAGPDGRVYAEVAVARSGASQRPGGRGLQAVTLVTVFENGIALQTCDLGTGPREEAGPDAAGVVYRFRPGLPVDELLRSHTRAVEAYMIRCGSLPRRYPPEQIVEVSLRYAECQRASEFAHNPLRSLNTYQRGPQYACAIPNIRPLAFIPG